MAFLDVHAWEEAGKRGEAVRAQKRAAHEAERRAHIESAVRTAAQQLVDARADGMRSASFGQFTEFERDIADLDGLDDLRAGYDVSSRLLGPWRAFRIELREQNVTLTAKARTEGQGCNRAHWVFDLAASW